MDYLKELLATRGVQLLSRYIGVGITALGSKMGATLSPEDTEGFAKVVGTFVLAGVFFLIDLYSHKKQQVV